MGEKLVTSRRVSGRGPRFHFIADSDHAGVESPAMQDQQQGPVSWICTVRPVVASRDDVAGFKQLRNRKSGDATLFVVSTQHGCSEPILSNPHCISGSRPSLSGASNQGSRTLVACFQASRSTSVCFHVSIAKCPRPLVHFGPHGAFVSRDRPNSSPFRRLDGTVAARQLCGTQCANSSRKTDEIARN